MKYVVEIFQFFLEHSISTFMETTGTYFERSISKIAINCLAKLTNEFDSRLLSDVLLEKKSDSCLDISPTTLKALKPKAPKT